MPEAAPPSSTRQVSHKPRIFVVVPAFCEERLIKKTIRGVPDCVETIIVVDDASLDRTAETVTALQDPRTLLLSHGTNRGVGASIYTGYDRALKLGADVIVVMAGDNQMDGEDLWPLVAPILEGRADYVKGNRHAHPRIKDMPRGRRWGSWFLAHLTSWAMGSRVADSQCGYTAISRRAASSIDGAKMWPRYGYPNDLLITLARRKFPIFEVPVRPVYGDEGSGLRPWHVLSILSVIVRSYVRERRAAARVFRGSYSKEQVIG